MLAENDNNDDVMKNDDNHHIIYGKKVNITLLGLVPLCLKLCTYTVTIVGNEENEVTMEVSMLNDKAPQIQLRVIEFFSGIGGMHYALKNLVLERKDIKHEVVAAYDFSTTANDVYRYNHTGSTVSSFYDYS